MKFYRNLFILLIVVGAIIAFLRLGMPNLVTPSGTPSPTPSPAPAAVPTPPPPQPRPAMTPAPTGYRSKLDALARTERVTFTRYAERGSTVDLTLDWIGDSVGPGGDFLDDGVKQGIIRDFKDTGKGEYYDKQGRRHFWQALELYMY